MINILKEIILDLQEIDFDTGVPRSIKVVPVEKKATVCIGVRRCGKSTYMYQLIQGLINDGVSRENIFYLNFFDDRLRRLQHEPLAIISEAYFSLYPEKKKDEKIYCFFDEIQVLTEWESFIDRLLRTENCEIYITGSSAQMLSKEVATQMRGRALSWEIFPFSFYEFLVANGIDYKTPLSSKKRLLIQKSFDNYFASGGFPEVIGLGKQLRIKIHQEYLGALLFRDLIERHDISHPKAITDLAHRLIDNIASLYSINKLTGYLKSLEHKVPKPAVSEYLEWFEDSYFLFTVRIFDSSLARTKTNPKKIYCIDHGLVTSTSSGILVNSGHLLENLIFVALRRVSSKIYYYKTKSGREVDFIVQKEDKTRMLIQVCEAMPDPNTYKREVTALSEAMREQAITEGIIVTRNEEKDIQVESGKITVLPAWSFLLKLSVDY